MTLRPLLGTEFAVFAQGRWRAHSRMTFEFGVRFNRDAVVEAVNWSPLAGVAIGVLTPADVRHRLLLFAMQ